MPSLNIGELYFRLGARTKGLEAAERRTKTFANRTSKDFQRTSRAARNLGIAIASIISIETTRRLLRTADNYAALTTRIKTATAATGDFNRVQSELLAISNANGTALETNVKLFQDLARAAPELGANNEQVLALTRAVGQLGVILSLIHI